MQQPENDLCVPPHSIQAEQSLLGGLMLDNDKWDDIADKVTGDDFYRREHRTLFAAMADLAERDQPLDVVTVAENLEAAGTLEEAGGLSYLGSIANDTPSAANVVAYAGIVRERSLLRQVLSVGTAVQEMVFSPEGRNAADMIGETERRLSAIGETTAAGSDPTSIKEYLAKFVDSVESAHNNEGVLGLQTGFTDLDKKTGGLKASDLIIVAGRPSMGKTAFAMNVAEQAALKQEKPVLVFSLEMPGDRIAGRMTTSVSRLPHQDVVSGKALDQHGDTWVEAVKALSGSPIILDDTPGLTPTDLRSRARRASRKYGPFALIVVDYLQLMRVPGIRADNRNAEVSEISRSLKALAKELDLPVVALSQLNRSVEQRTNKRPIMSDLRDSGAIEQDADLILFMYRDEVYDESSHLRGIAEVVIGKNREGETGTVYLTSELQRMRFENFTGEIPRKGAEQSQAPSEDLDWMDS
jgi:replicative DNA helicase